VHHGSAAASWVKKVVSAESCNFPTDHCKFPIEDTTGAQNFNFAPKFPQNGGFLALNFVFLNEKFPTGITFLNRLKFRGGGIVPCPLATPALWDIRQQRRRTPPQLRNSAYADECIGL